MRQKIDKQYDHHDRIVITYHIIPYCIEMYCITNKQQHKNEEKKNKQTNKQKKNIQACIQKEKNVSYLHLRMQKHTHTTAIFCAIPHRTPILTSSYPPLVASTPTGPKVQSDSQKSGDASIVFIQSPTYSPRPLPRSSASPFFVSYHLPSRTTRPVTTVSGRP